MKQNLHFFKITFNKFQKNFSLSASDYEEFEIKNNNTQSIKSLIDSDIVKGTEIGSSSYMYDSDHFFLRTKALQENFFFIDKNKEASVPMKPTRFVTHNLKRGMILISKDSKIGEISYLEKDYPNFMLSAGIIGFEIKKEPYYVLAFLKNPFFKDQINTLVPSHGSTLIHAKTIFLDCKIPFPNKNHDSSIIFVREIQKGILRRELEIQKKHDSLNIKFEDELQKNQNNKKYVKKFPLFSEIEATTRLDSGPYGDEYKKWVFMIKNYKNGFYTISKKLFKIGNTPPKRVIGKGFTRWITADYFDELGYLIKKIPIICKPKNILKDCLIIKNRTNKQLLGEFVGTGFFYNYKKFGDGHHHQGCYRVDDLPSDDLRFLTICLNTKIYRKICSYVSLGSKMPELKSSQLSSIPFIKINENIKKELIKIYDNESKIYIKKIKVLDFENFDKIHLDDIGILQVAEQIDHLKDKLNYCVNQIKNDEEIDLDLNFIPLNDIS